MREQIGAGVSLVGALAVLVGAVLAVAFLAFVFLSVVWAVFAH